MKILQIEDTEGYKLGEADTVETFEEAKEKLGSQKYGACVIDGNFPLKKGDNPEINVQLVIEYLREIGFAGKTIVWTNSIRAQKYCEDNSVLCFSKKERTEEHVQKMREYGLAKYAVMM